MEKSFGFGVLAKINGLRGMKDSRSNCRLPYHWGLYSGYSCYPFHAESHGEEHAT